MYRKRIKVIIRQADPYNRTWDATEGGGGGISKFKEFFFTIVTIIRHTRHQYQTRLAC